MGRKPTPITITDPALAEAFAEIDRWHDTFVNAHETHLASPQDFPDRHLAESELQKIRLQAAAIRARMREDYLSRWRPPGVVTR